MLGFYPLSGGAISTSTQDNINTVTWNQIPFSNSLWSSISVGVPASWSQISAPPKTWIAILATNKG